MEGTPVNRPLIIIIMAVVLLANVPWFFHEAQMTHVWGFPPWAVYSFAMIILFAVVTSVFIGKYWDVMAGPEEEDDKLHPP